MEDAKAEYPFTHIARDILTKTTDIAISTKAQEIQPSHLFFALLVGHESEDLRAPENPTTLWSVLKDLEHDPSAVADVVEKQLARRQQVATPGGSSTSLSHSTKVADPPKSHHFQTLRNLLKRPSKNPMSELAPSPSRLNVNVQEKHSSPVPSNEFVNVIRRALSHKDRLGDDFIGPYHLLLSLSEDTSIKAILYGQNIGVAEFVTALQGRRGVKITNAEDDLFPFLSKYSTDMTALARTHKLNDIIGRDEEIRRVIQILCRKTKNSAVFLGEPGVGKTAVAEGLAHRIANNQVPEHLRGTVYSLDLGALFAGAGNGEYEQRVKGVIDDVMRSQQGPNPAILFIDEMHLITVGKSPGGQSSKMDAANLLKPALARGQFRCIGATTLAEYREYIEKDGALERRFATVMVNEPTVDEASTILRGIRNRYEDHHRVWIMDQAIVTAVNLASRYLTSRRLPDSAVDLMDEACASARIAQDMKPAAIDEVEQRMLQVGAHIEALQRDNHPGDHQALEEAFKMKDELNVRKSCLQSDQKAVEEYWKDVRAQRDIIKNKRNELEQRKAHGSSSRVKTLEQDIANLQAGLKKTEDAGPNLVDHGGRLSDRDGHTIATTSPHIITAESIAAVVGRATKIPVQRLLATDKSRLLGLESTLNRQVVGQPEAVRAVAEAIQLSRTGLSNENRPIASLLFTGPSGTGKTLLSKALAEELFGQSTAMVRIDGSEYSQSHSVSRLIGSPPGYVGYDQGGQLTEYVRRTPYCIVLLDEIEKTCVEFLTIFLQVLDEGRLTDGKGRLVDFRNCVIIMTSNVGADILARVQDDQIPEQTRNDVMRRFKEARFPVEFLNRIDQVVMFHTMSNDMMRKILEKHLRDIQQREGLKNFRLNVQEDAKEWLIKAGISREYGARPLARVIQRELLNTLSQQLLQETLQPGDTITVGVKDDKKGLEVRSSGVDVPVNPYVQGQNSVPRPVGGRQRDSRMPR